MLSPSESSVISVLNIQYGFQVNSEHFSNIHTKIVFADLTFEDAHLRNKIWKNHLFSITTSSLIFEQKYFTYLQTLILYAMLVINLEHFRQFVFSFHFVLLFFFFSSVINLPNIVLQSTGILGVAEYRGPGMGLVVYLNFKYFLIFCCTVK